VVRAKVAVLANAMSVVRSVYVRAFVSRLFSASRVVTVLAHSFSVEVKFRVRARGNILFAFRLTSLLSLFTLTNSSLSASLNLSAQAARHLFRLSVLRYDAVTRDRVSNRRHILKLIKSVRLIFRQFLVNLLMMSRLETPLCDGSFVSFALRRGWSLQIIKKEPVG
jgi:hypothetical protein